MKCQLQSMSAFILMLLSINVSNVEMLGTYPIAGMQVLKCHKHDLYQVYMKLSGIEMSYT